MRLKNHDSARFAKLLVFALIFTSFISTPAQAVAPAFGTSTSVNTSGLTTLTFTGLAATPDGTKVIASAGSGYLIYSSDSGTTWSSITSAGIHNWNAVAINDSGTVMAAGDSGGYIYLSTNSGATWTAQTSTYPGVGAWNSIDVNSSGSVIAATSNGTSVAVTSNSGTSWALRTVSGSGGNKSIFVSSNGDKIVFISNTSLYAYLSSDTGTTFVTQTAPGVATSSYNCLWASRDGQKMTFASSATVFARSINGGSTWDTITVTSSVCSGFVASEDMTSMWIGNNGGSSAYSTNSGSTWSFTSLTANLWSTININTSGTHWIAALPTSGVYTSDGPPSGLTKRPAYLGASSWSRSAISSDGSVIAVSSYGGEVSVSRDGGNTWSVGTGLPASNLNWNCLAVSGDGTTMYAAGSASRIYKSINKGLSWAIAGSDTYTAANYSYNGCVTNSDGSKVAVISGTYGVLISTNSGTSFSQSLSNSFNSTTYTYMNVTMTADGTKWAVNETAANSPIIVNTNSGTNGSWTITSGVPTRAGGDLKSSGDGSVLIATFGNTLAPMISRDWGATWGSLSGVASTFSNGTSISTNGSLIVMGQAIMNTGLLYYSTDKGATFTQVPGAVVGNIATASVAGNGTGFYYGIAGRYLQYISFTLTPKASFASLTTSGNAAYRTQVTLTATLALAGTDGAVTFYANGKAIPGCIKVATSSLVATCSWKPSARGGVTISVNSFPSDTGYTQGSRAQFVSVANRSGNR